jgi:hypothetical protein
VILWDVKKGVTTETLEGHAGVTETHAFSPDDPLGNGRPSRRSPATSQTITRPRRDRAGSGGALVQRLDPEPVPIGA